MRLKFKAYEIPNRTNILLTIAQSIHNNQEELFTSRFKSIPKIKTAHTLIHLTVPHRPDRYR